MENTARLTGYAIALTVLGGLLALVLMLQDGALFRANEVRVVFPAIGTLMEDDPVKLHGVEVGRVADISATPEGSVATLDLCHRVPLATDSRFVNYNYILCGARMVILVRDNS